jgi:hypothetical protein
LQQLASLPVIEVADEFSDWSKDAQLVIPFHAHRYIGMQARTVSSLIARVDLMTQMEVILEAMWRQPVVDSPVDLTTELDESLVHWKIAHLSVIGSQPMDRVPSHLLLLKMVGQSNAMYVLLSG